MISISTVLCLVLKVNGTMNEDSFTGKAYAIIGPEAVYPVISKRTNNRNSKMNLFSHLLKGKYSCSPKDLFS